MSKLKEAKLVDIEFIAALMHKTPNTIRMDLTRRPKSLPPRLMIPDSRTVLWLESDVLCWLEDLRQ